MNLGLDLLRGRTGHGAAAGGLCPSITAAARGSPPSALRSWHGQERSAV